MPTVTANSATENYQYLDYPSNLSSFNEFEKLFLVVGQVLRGAEYYHALSVDSYGILEKTTYLVENIKQPTPQIESYVNTYLPDILQSFFPGQPFSSIEELRVNWQTKFFDAITPTGLSNYISFLVGVYLYYNGVHKILRLEEDTMYTTVTKLSEFVSTYIHEWSSTQEVVVNGVTFFPDSLNFMEIAILISLSPNVYSLINPTKLAKYINTYLKDDAFYKLTPTLKIAYILVNEDLNG